MTPPTAVPLLNIVVTAPLADFGPLTITSDSTTLSSFTRRPKTEALRPVHRVVCPCPTERNFLVNGRCLKQHHTLAATRISQGDRNLERGVD